LFDLPEVLADRPEDQPELLQDGEGHGVCGACGVSVIGLAFAKYIFVNYICSNVF
jgi:hypothetical protein